MKGKTNQTIIHRSNEMSPKVIWGIFIITLLIAAIIVAVVPAFLTKDSDLIAPLVVKQIDHENTIDKPEVILADAATVDAEIRSPNVDSFDQELNSNITKEGRLFINSVSDLADALNKDDLFHNHNLFEIEYVLGEMPMALTDTELDQLMHVLENKWANELNPEFAEVFLKLFLLRSEEKAYYHTFQPDMTKAWADKNLAKKMKAMQMGILGEDLYQKIYDPEETLAQHTCEGCVDTLNDPAEKELRATMDRLDANEISLTQARKELLATLELNEVEELLAMKSAAEQSEQKRNDFMEEYQFVINSGITGEDELLVRDELLHKYFPENEVNVANQSLFDHTERP